MRVRYTTISLEREDPQLFNMSYYQLIRRSYSLFSSYHQLRNLTSFLNTNMANLSIEDINRSLKDAGEKLAKMSVSVESQVGREKHEEQKVRGLDGLQDCI